MQIALGQAVFTSDGARIGAIDRVLLDPIGNHVEHFVVHRGIFLDHDRVVPRASIERVDAAGVHLSLDAEAAKSLPRFEHSFDIGEIDPGYPQIIPGPFQNMVLFPSPAAGMTYLDHGHLFTLRPLEETPERPSSGPLEHDIVIGKGADVIGSDGNRIGYVHELIYGDDGALEVVIVQTGLVRHHRHAILAEQIAEIGDEEIKLNVTSERLTPPE